MCAACRSKVKRLIFKLDRNINVETLAKLVGTVFGLGPQRSEAFRARLLHRCDIAPLEPKRRRVLLDRLSGTSFRQV